MLNSGKCLIAEIYQALVRKGETGEIGAAEELIRELKVRFQDAYRALQVIK